MNIFNSLGSNYNFDFVLNSLFVSGTDKEARKLEDKLSERFGGKAILLYKGREAIEAALKLSGLGKGARIAVCGYTCYAVVKAVDNAGFIAEYIDIDDGLNYSAGALSEKLKKTQGIGAVIVQNTLGYPCDIAGIEKIAKDKKLVLIEDLAHSAGTLYKDGRAAGTVGDFAILSFSQDKIIDGISGGALIVRNKNLTSEVKRLPIVSRQESIDRFYPLLTFLIRKLYQIKLGKILHFMLKKLNLLSQPMTYGDSGSLHQLSAWYAAIICRELEDLDKNAARRRRIAEIYVDTIDKKVLIRQVLDKVDISTNLRFPIIIDDRKGLIGFLKGKGVFVSDIWYDAPVAPKKYMDKVKYDGSCRLSEEVSRKMLNLPTHKNVSERDAKEIAKLVNIWLQK